MSHCRACDALMYGVQRKKTISTPDGDIFVYEDLCYRCLPDAIHPDNVDLSRWKWTALEDLCKKDSISDAYEESKQNIDNFEE